MMEILQHLKKRSLKTRYGFTYLIVLILSGSLLGQINEANCNQVDPWVNTPFSGLSASITENVPDLSPLCIGTIDNLAGLMDTDLTNYATLSMTGIGCDGEISVVDATDEYPAGTFAGFKISSDDLLIDATIGAGVTISTYNNGTLQDSYVATSAIVGIDADLIANDGTAVVGFIAPQAFDEIRIRYDALTAVLFDAEIHYAVIEKFCDGPLIGCNELEAITTPEYPIFIKPDNTGATGAACVLCGVSDPNNVINTDATDFATLNVTGGVLAGAELSVKNQLNDYDSGTFTGFDVENSNLVDASILSNITITTYLNGIQRESKSGNTSLVLTGTDILTDEGRKTVGFITSLTYDEVQISVANIVGVDIGSTKVFGVIFSEFCQIDVVCDTSYFLTNTKFPVIIDAFETGVSGTACTGSSVENAPNVINSDNTDFGTISIGANALCSGSIAVLDALNVFPMGSKTGFTIEVTDPTLINLGVQLFDAITICTYLDGIQQECQTGSNLIDVELLVLFINDGDGVYNVGFETTLPFDEIKITVSSLITVLNEVNVYAAYVDTRGAMGDGFQCCPVDTPELSALTISNNCPTKTVNLNSLETSTAPTNASLVWYTNNIHSGSPYPNPETAVAGNYYAYYYDSVNDCFTPASDRVVATVAACSDLQVGIVVSESMPDVGDTITFTITVNNNGPDGATNVFGTDTIPFGYEFISSTSSVGSYDTMTWKWDIGSLNSSGQETLTITVVVADTLDYINTATIEGDQIDQDLTNNSASESVTPVLTCDPAGQMINFDCDDDGLTNIEEITGIDNPNTPPDPNGILTDPGDPDSDGDGVTDGDEALDLTNPNNACDFNPESVTLTPDVEAQELDCDGDGVTNINELLDQTSPVDPCEFVLTSVTINATSQIDCDGDGVPLWHEVNGLDNNFATPLDNTSPFDSCEYNVIHQDSIPSAGWMLTDCDGDGVSNGDEYRGLDGDSSTVNDNTNPLDPCSLNLSSVSMNATSTGDCDGDGVTNADEINGIDDDYSESADNTDPNNACDYNPLDITGPVTGDQSSCNFLYAMNDINVISKNNTTSGDLYTNDFDPEYQGINLSEASNANGAPLNIAGAVNFLPSGASLRVFPDGTYSYTPFLGFTGTDAFSYKICDSGEPQVCDNADVEIQVLDTPNSTNNPPLVSDDTGMVPNDAILSGSVTGNDSDVDGDMLVVNTMPVSGPTNGTINLNADGTFTYNPNPGFVGVEVIEYQVCDDVIPALCGTGTLEIEVTPPNANNELYANDDAVLGWENTAMNIDLLANDTDHEGNTLGIPTVITGGEPSHGEYTINQDGILVYDPDPNYKGDDQIVYAVCDDGNPSICDTATVYINIFNTFCFDLDMRVYLEGALIKNGGAVGSNGEPLMRDDLRSSPFADTLGTNFIPTVEPYTSLSNFTHVGSGGGEMATETAFDENGQNSVVDWVFIEFRSRFNGTDVVETRSALLQRDGDIVDVDGVSSLQVCGFNNSMYIIAIRHRNHLGAMCQSVMNIANVSLIDFTGFENLLPLFDFGTNHPKATSSFDYSGLTMKTHSTLNVRMLWAGNANGDDKIKYLAPGDDVFTIFRDLLTHSQNGSRDYNFDKGYGYFSGDIDMNSKVKFQAPGDDNFSAFRQLLLYPLNPGRNYNFDLFFDQLK